jgi:ferredoxin
VCEAAAIDHGQIPQESILEVQAVLYADPAQPHLKAARVDGDGIWHAAPHDPLAGAAGAAQMMHHMGPTSRAKPAQTQTAIGHTPTTLGLFICQCGGAISEHVDTQALRQAFVRQADMALVEIVPMACTPEGTRHIRQASATPPLGGAVLAACTCCDWDQVCFSCTLQRVRCKQQLGIVGNHSGPPQGPHPAGDVAFPGLPFEFVNIREQCAWAHSNDIRAATAKATRMIAAALARVCQQPKLPAETARVDRSVMILGTASSGDICEQFLTAHNISVQRVAEAPHQVLRHSGRYVTTRNGTTWETAGVVLSPQNNREQEQLLRAFGPRMLRPSPRPYQAPLATHRPGVLMCDPLADGSVSGAAAAARMVGWLERWAAGHNPHAALVDGHRCRACGTCIETCAYGAPWIDNAAEEPAARIDPVICQGCGTCAARCPSGAIAAMDITDSQMEATLSVVGHGISHEETA